MIEITGKVVGMGYLNPKITIAQIQAGGAPTYMRFLSCEPLIGPLDALDLTGIDWVIVGGESGPGCQPMGLAWARSIQAQCKTQSTAFFMKQLGGVWDKRGELEQLPEDLRVREFPQVGPEQGSLL